MHYSFSIDTEWEQQSLDTIDSSEVGLSLRTKEILIDTLQLELNPEDIREDMPLLGAFQELDSMTVVSLLTTLEEHFGFVIHDEEVTAEVFETFGSLLQFVERNLK